MVTDKDRKAENFDWFSYFSTYLQFCTSYWRSVSFVRLCMLFLPKRQNFNWKVHLHKKLLTFKIWKIGQILCACKPGFSCSVTIIYCMVAGGYVYKFNTTVTANNIYIYTYVTLLLFANYTAVVNMCAISLLMHFHKHARTHVRTRMQLLNRLINWSGMSSPNLNIQNFTNCCYLINTTHKTPV